MYNLRIENVDDICLARALVVGQAFADRSDYQNLYRQKKLQKNAAYTLIKKAGLAYREFTIADLPKFEEVSRMVLLCVAM